MRKRALENNSQKHVPLRMCIVCRKMLPKSSLIRIVSSDGEAVVDKDGKIQKRGAYVCKCEKCISVMCKKHSLDRAFKSKQPESAYDNVQQYFLSIDREDELH